MQQARVRVRIGGEARRTRENPRGWGIYMKSDGSKLKNAKGPSSVDELGPFQDRLKLVVGDKPVRAFARECGLSDTVVRQYLSGKSEPGRAALVSIAETAGVSLEWLVAGRGSREESALDEGGYVMIRRVDVQASAGEGTIIYGEDELTPVPFRSEEIKRLHVDPQNLTVIEVRGESMSPTLLPGDEVMVDLTGSQTIVDGIYAVRIDDTLMVKRVQHLPGKRLMVTSDNPAYQSFQVDIQSAAEEDFVIVGRVLWAGRRF